MPTELHTTTTTLPGGSDAVAYTVPAGRTATIVSALIANASDYNLNSRSFSVRWKRGSTTTTVAANVSLNAGISANPLSIGKLTLEAGDQVLCRDVTSSAPLSYLGARIATTDTVGGTIYRVASNLAGTTLFLIASTGIYRSTDSMATFTRVYSGGAAVANGAFLAIGTDLFAYTSTTSALRSTDDGLTWSTQAITNGPSTSITHHSGISGVVKNGSTAVAMASATQLISTADGITWSNLGVALPQACSQFCWTGARYVAIRDSTARDLYHSTNGAAWTTVNNPNGTSGTFLTGLDTDGAGDVVITSQGGPSTVGVSVDDGQTWTSYATPGAVSTSNGRRVLYTGGRFLVQPSSSIAGWFTSTAPASVAFSTGGLGRDIVSLALDSTGRAFVSSGGIVYASADSSLTPTYGMEMTLSIMEVF